MTLKDWLDDNLLDYIFLDDRVFTIDNKVFLLIEEKSGKIFNDDFELIVDNDDYLLSEVCDYFCFKFGTKFYYSDKKGGKPVILKYLGKSKEYLQDDFPYLGIHGKFDILNGNKDYSVWVKKAKFLGYDSLAITENDSLAGSFIFQETCLANNIKPIIGVTSNIKNKDKVSFRLKLLAKDKTGIANLIRLVNYQNVEHVKDNFFTLEELKTHSQGLVVILTNHSLISDGLFGELLRTFRSDLYYQIDLTQWKSDSRDKDILLNTQKFIENFKDFDNYILCDDAFYLDKDQSTIKKKLNDVANIFEYQSIDQHFKTKNEILNNAFGLFQNEDFVYKAYLKSQELSIKCNGLIEKGSRLLPKFIIPENYKSLVKDNEEYFWLLIKKGILNKLLGKVEDIDSYYDRIQKEFEVISKGGIIDYFLILSDISDFCKENNILRGHGRGSSAGSLISYLLNIVEVDPIKYDLLFERFLNEARLGIFEEIIENKVSYRESEDYFVLTLEDGSEKLFSSNSEFSIKRDSQKMIVKISELKEEDIIL